MKRIVLVAISALLIVSGLVYCLLFAPAEKMLGEVYRIIYFHIPCAWIAVLAFIVSFGGSLAYLVKGRQSHDHLANVSAEIGLLFTILATITGSIFASFAWGSPWNWDPRETSIVFLMLIYFAYLALRWMISDPEKRARISSIYSIIAFVSMPFLVFVIPRITASLHPDVGGGLGLTSPMRLGMYWMLAGFTFLYWAILDLAHKVAKEELP